MNNSSKVRNVLEGTSLSNDQIDLIMGSIDEIQEKINTQTNQKLQDYVVTSKLTEMETEFAQLSDKLVKA